MPRTSTGKDSGLAWRSLPPRKVHSAAAAASSAAQSLWHMKDPFMFSQQSMSSPVLASSAGSKPALLSLASGCFQQQHLQSYVPHWRMRWQELPTLINSNFHMARLWLVELFLQKGFSLSSVHFPILRVGSCWMVKAVPFGVSTEGYWEAGQG